MNSKPKQILLFGDSITEYYNQQEFLPEYINLINLGRAGDTVSMAIHRVNQLQAFTIEKLFVLLGINDLAEGDSPKVIVGHYRKLLEAIHAITKAPLYIQSVLPANRLSYADAQSPQLINSQVAEINLGLHQLAASNGHTFIDLYPHFNENSLLNPALTHDGLHLNKEGYLKYTELIQPYLPA